MNEREKGALIYILIVNSLVLIALGFVHLLFLSPLRSENLSLASNLATLDAKEKAVAKDLAEHLRGKEAVKKQLEALLAFSDANFCTGPVELVQRSVSEAFSETAPDAGVILGFSRRDVAGANSLFVSSDFPSLRAADAFAAFGALSKRHFAVADSIFLSELTTGEIAVRYDFLIPFSVSAAGISKGGL